MKWKPDWPQARANLIKWWDRQGLALFLTAPRDEPVEHRPQRPRPEDIRQRWTDPVYRCDATEYVLSRTAHLAEAFPQLSTQIGPGSLGIFIGSEPQFADSTVWYKPCITDPDHCGPIGFDPRNNRWLEVHLAFIDEALRRCGGRYVVGMPDLIENLDTLAALRDTEELMADLVDRPQWVLESLWQINEAFYAAFDLMYKLIEYDGGNAFIFSIWGPGKTAKIQCDLSCMLSPEMFRRFVAPPLAAQCRWLDYSLYHLDGEDAWQHLDALLGIDALDAIEWTPRALYTGKKQEMGGSPKWYDLYRRILAGGKGVQAICVHPDQVVPLLHAVGPAGMFVQVHADSMQTAEKLLRDVEQFR